MPVPSARIAVALLEELLAGGMRDVVLAPGSRSAPLALALADAERRGLVRLHVRVDERSAAYLALGLARVSRAPVGVVTTSGTAAVNLHPAVVEAAYSGVPLITVTADRPGSMRGSGSPQTIDQRGIFGVDAVTSLDVEGLDEATLRSSVAAALDRARGETPGPIHLNVPLAEPLVSVQGHHVTAVPSRSRTASGNPAREPSPPLLADLLPPGVTGSRGLIVAGDFDDPEVCASAGFLASALGWPILSEPSGNLSSHPQALRHGPLLLGTDRHTLDGDHVPEVVITIGRVGLHRSVTAALRQARVHIAVDVAPRLRRVDPARTAVAIVDAVPDAEGIQVDPAWCAHWRDADAEAAQVVDTILASADLSGPIVARMVAAHAGVEDLLVIGASWPVRHVSAYAGPIKARCIGNRGTSGIDGVVSTAWGAALAHADQHPAGTTYALVGDLTAIYDRNGLLSPASEARPRLDYIVIDNDGGGIFSSLEQGAPDFAEDFDRVFGTPHGADLPSLLAAPGVETVVVTTAPQLAALLASPGSGVRVIIARCASRGAEADLVRSLQPGA